jgi:4'-phosphopantetheinyl transferase
MLSGAVSEATCAVEVWIVELEDVDDAQLRAWFEWLDDDEKAKHGRFVTDHLRREYLVTRALSRWALSRSLPDVAPSEWRFERTDAGKPFVVAPASATTRVPHFNLANAGGLVACAVGPQRLGVDVEPASRGDELLSTSSPLARLFSARELEAMRELDAAGKRRRTVELWTLKEAYLKARGGGISVHLDHFSVLSTTAGFRLDADALDGDPADWQLESALYSARSDFVVAVAVNRGRKPDVSVMYKAMD